MSIIDNYSTLFTAQNISAKQDTHNVMNKNTGRWDFRLPGGIKD